MLSTAALFAGGSTAAAGRHVTLGRSVEGRPIVAYELGDPASPRKVLVVGCVHGDEPGGKAITRRLAAAAAPAGVDLWIVPSFNPDGEAAGVRGNAHGVDLNRNFPLGWQRLVGIHNSGPRPLSEPESRVAYRLILRLRPGLSIWFHQHMNVVDESGGNLGVERRFATLAGLPTARLAREPGSVVTWENDRLRRGTAFVVELPAGTLSHAAAARFAHAVDVLARG
jgi:murein peptide amidase A